MEAGIDLLLWIRACKGVANSIGDLQLLLDLPEILEHTNVALCSPLVMYEPLNRAACSVIERVSVLYSDIEFGAACIPMMLSMHCSEKAKVIVYVIEETIGSAFGLVMARCAPQGHAAEIADALTAKKINYLGLWEIRRRRSCCHFDCVP
jgi:hypothetical protein